MSKQEDEFYQIFTMIYSLRIIFVMLFTFCGYPTYASDFYASCKVAGSTITSIKDKNTPNSRFTALTMMSDITAACEDGNIAQGTMGTEACKKHLLADNYLHKSIKVLANCVSGEVDVGGNKIELPIMPTCENGGHAIIEAFKILCPKSGIKLISLDKNHQEMIEKWHTAHSICRGVTDDTEKNSEKACELRASIGKTLNSVGYCFFNSEYSWFSCDAPPSYVDSQSRIDRRIKPKVYQSNNGQEFKLACNQQHLVLSEKPDVKSTNVSSRSLYLSNSCAAFHPKHGIGNWSWANGGFEANFSTHKIRFPRAEIFCEPEPSFINDCRQPVANFNKPFVVDTCSFKYEGKYLINGKCWINVSENGSFDIRNYQQESPYFAYVSPRKGNFADGWYNGKQAGSHAHDELGRLERRGFCWLNTKTEICIGALAGKVLPETKHLSKLGVKWTIKKPTRNKNKMLVCEVVSSEKLGIRFIEDGSFVFALLDVPLSKIERLHKNIVVGSTQIEASINFGRESTYGIDLTVFDERINEFGQRQFIIGLSGFHSHITDELISGENVFVQLGGDTTLSPYQVRKNADLIYSLKGSSKPIKSSQASCWN